MPSTARDVAETVACFTDDAHVEFDGGVEVMDGTRRARSILEGPVTSPRMGRTASPPT